MTAPPHSDGAGLPPDRADAAAERLLACDPAQRAAVLAQLCAEMPHHAGALQRLADELAGADALLGHAFTRASSREPTQLAGHRVVRKLGEGAFGVVYLCAQETPIRREVAIKVLRPGAGDARTLRRFMAERQVLASLNHPSITQVFDAGELDDGRPFFVMEHVAGRPIRAFSDERSLACDDRLRLFVQVCRGVAHAHTRGIVHRDLKPANVLVVDGDDGPMPKIIDFGIAKALVTKDTGDAPAADGPRTDAGRVVGTPGYMSPEQAAGRGADVDGRADVFALGVMLYELLTGQLPWADGAGATETDPPRPSARVTTATHSAAPAVVAERRQLAAQLRGDLDWITLKALARDRDERYASVAALIADVERHLRGETVSVGPPSLRYRLRKFVRRHRVAVATTAVGLGLVVALAVTVAYAMDRNTAAIDAVSDTQDVAARLLDRANDPALYASPAGDEVRKLLGREALRLAEQLLAKNPDDPRLQVVQCEVLQTMAQVHWLLGEPEQSRTAADRAVALAQQLFAAAPTELPRQARLGRALRQQGRAIMQAGDHPAANVVFDRAAERLAACAKAEPASYAASYATVLRECATTLPPAERARAIELCRQAVALFESLPADAATAAALRDDRLGAGLGLARALLEGRELDAARAELERIEPTIAALPPSHFQHRGEFHHLRGSVAWDKLERLPALPDLAIAADIADAWCATQPRRNAAHRLRIARLTDLAVQQNYVEDFDAATASFRRAMAAGEAMVREFPEDVSAQAMLCSRLYHFAYVLRDRFRQRDLAEASSCLKRAIELDAGIAATVVSGRLARWRFLAALAGIEESRGSDEAGALYEELDGLMPAGGAHAPDALQNDYLNACAGIARWWLARGALDRAVGRLEVARTFLAANASSNNKLGIEIEYLQACVDAARGDHAAAAAAGPRILAMRNTWYSRRRAADCTYVAWRAAVALPEADPGVVDGYHGIAEQWYEMVVRSLDEDVAKTPGDPWYVLPWGFSQLHRADLAAAAGDADGARELLAAALPRLEAVRADVQMDQWDEPSFVAGKALAERLGR